MKNGKLVGAITASLLIPLVLHTQAARAQTPASARMIQMDFVRAYDAYSATNMPVTVVNPGSVNGSTPTNSATDTATGWKKAHLRLRAANKRKGAQIALTGKGFITPAPTKVGLQLTLRTTNLATSPVGNQFTYEDETVICGTSAGSSCGHYFAPDGSGKIRGAGSKMSLATCMTQNNLPTLLAAGNVEVLSAELVNCDTGKVFGVSGILQANP